MNPYYQDDYVTLYHADCLQHLDMLNQADVLITDPPYGIGWRIGDHPKRGSSAHVGIQNDADTTARDTVLAEWGSEKPGVVFAGWKKPLANFTDLLVWKKPIDAGVVGSITGFRRDTEAIYLTGVWPRRRSTWTSVLETTGGKARYYAGHPHSKPVPLLERLISLTPGTVIDPFAGSGSTLRAAKNLGRKAIGFEIEEKYCEIAAQRLAQETLGIFQ